MAAYSAAVLERVRNPQRVGTLPESAEVGTGEAGSLDTGTLVRIQVRVRQGRIAEARFKVFGCSAAIAAAGLVAEWLEGAGLDDVRQLRAERVVEQLTLAEDRVHVAGIAIAAARQAVQDVNDKTGRQA
jgi:nitrogen fixation NifU-like protein